jgi:hypothetical protein
MKTNLKKAIIYLLGALATALGILWGMTSCTVSRQVTTTAEYFNRGDTVVNIQSRTIETYTGSKNK